MADTNMSYDHPQYLVAQFVPMRAAASAASSSVRKFVAHTSIKVKKISAIVMIAGTAAAAGYDVLNGTTSVGALTLGTSAAGSIVALTTDISISSGSYLDIKTKADSATMAADLVVEFRLPAGANVVG